MRPDQKLIENLKNSDLCIEELNEIGNRLSVDAAVKLLNQYGNASGTGGHWHDITKITQSDYVQSEGELKRSDIGKYRDLDGNILTSSEIFKWLKEVEEEVRKEKEEENRLKNDHEYAATKKKEEDDRRAARDREESEYRERKKLRQMKDPTYHPKGVERGGKTLADLAKKAGFHFDYDSDEWIGGSIKIFIDDLKSVGFERSKYSDGTPNYTDNAGYQWFERELSSDGTFAGTDNLSIGVNPQKNSVNLYLYANRQVIEAKNAPLMEFDESDRDYDFYEDVIDYEAAITKLKELGVSFTRVKDDPQGYGGQAFVFYDKRDEVAFFDPNGLGVYT